MFFFVQQFQFRFFVYFFSYCVLCVTADEATTASLLWLLLLLLTSHEQYWFSRDVFRRLNFSSFRLCLPRETRMNNDNDDNLCMSERACMRLWWYLCLLPIAHSFICPHNDKAATDKNHRFDTKATKLDFYTYVCARILRWCVKE